MTTVVHVRSPQFDRSNPDHVYCGRAAPRLGLVAGRWANPYKIGRDGMRAAVIEKFREYLRAHPAWWPQIRRELAGKVLGCWCAPEPCHCDVLARVADGGEP